MRRTVLIPILLALTSGPVFADEGMWTFDNFPSGDVKRKYGVDIDAKWLDHVRNSAVRLAGGCSASLVSPDGLVLTNHHCVAGCVQNLSTPQNDYLKNGFFPKSREDEELCPGQQAEILQSIDDVTGKINSATSGKNGQEFTRARDAIVATIENESCAGREATHRCQVISLYDGGQYKLYAYRKYSDVRLAFAPEFQAAFFGGDPDNFNFPRYDLDFSFLRLYENGRPVATPEHLKWNASAPKEGDPVFVVGNPGGTDRLLTASQLLTLRNLVLPTALFLNSELRGQYTRFSEESAEHARIVNRDLFGIENAIKAQKGQFQTLLSPSLIDSKRKADAELKAKVDSDPKLKAEIGDPWAEIDQIQADREALYKRYIMTDGRAGFGSSLFGYARAIVRAAEEKTKPNTERLREYADARLPLLEKNVLDARPVYREVEELKLKFWLTKIREELTADAPETALFLGKESPEALAKSLAQSKLDDPVLRKALWEGGMAAIKASPDPMIQYVLRVDPVSRAMRKEVEERIEGPTARATERIARAYFAAHGTSVYPDATFSLRISYGKIAGWTYRGETIPPFTYLRGLYERATGFFPFDLPPSWIAARDKLNLDTVFNMSSDNDIIGGNSGSPLIDARGEVIGAIFDGNIHSLGGNFYFDPELNRAVSVSTAAITEALTKVYGETRLIAELTRP